MLTRQQRKRAAGSDRGPKQKRAKPAWVPPGKIVWLNGLSRPDVNGKRVTLAGERKRLCKRVVNALVSFRGHAEELDSILDRVPDQTLFDLLCFRLTHEDNGSPFEYALLEIMRHGNTRHIDRALSMIDMDCYDPAWRPERGTRDDKMPFVSIALVLLQNWRVLLQVLDMRGTGIFTSIDRRLMSQILMGKLGVLEEITGRAADPHNPWFSIVLMETIVIRCGLSGPQRDRRVLFARYPRELWIECAAHFYGADDAVRKRAVELTGRINRAAEKRRCDALAELPEGEIVASQEEF